MAKIFYVVEKAGDYTQCNFFKTEKEALAYGISEFPDFDMFDEPREDLEDDAWFHGDKLEFKKGILFSFEEGSAYVEAYDEDEAREYCSDDIMSDGAAIFFDGFTKGMYGYLGNGADGKGRKWDWDGGRFNESKITKTTLKHVKLFEAFVASQKLNEGWNGPIIDGFEELLNTGIGVEKAYDQMKKSGVLKGLETEFNGYLLRIKTGFKGYEYTSINIWDKENVKKAEETHQKEHGFPLDREKSSTILNSYEDGKGGWSIYGGQWSKPNKNKAKKYKVSDFTPLSDSGDDGLGGDEADSKWEPVLDAFGVSYLDDLVWLGEYFPEIVEEEGRLVKSFSLDGFGDEDPHGDADVSIYKWKGMLLGWHDDDYRYSATLCRAKDVVKLASLLEDDESLDIY